MNKIFKVIWSKARNCYVVVSELAKSHDDGHVRRSRSGCCRKAAILAAFALTTSLAAVPVWAADANGNITNNGASTMTGSNPINQSKNSVIYGSGNAVNNSENAVVVGNGNTGNTNSVVIGNGALSNAEGQIVIGRGKANGEAVGSIVIGNNETIANTSQSVLIGNDAKANGSGQGIIVIGNGAMANSNAAGYTDDNKKYIPAGIVLGEYSYSSTRAGKDGYLSDKKGDRPSTAFNEKYWDAVWTATANPMAIGNVDTDANGNGGDHTGHGILTRQITGVAAGTDLTDAVNVAQLKAAVAQFSGGGSGTGGSGVHDYSVKSVKPDTDTNYNNKGATGDNALAAGVSASAIGAQSVAVGNSAQAIGAQSVAVGNNAQAIDQDSIALGTNAKAEGKGAAAIGQYNTASGQNSLAFGGGYNKEQKGNTASGVASVAFGEGTQAIAEGTLAFGQNTQAGVITTDDKGNIQIGGQDAVAFGRGTKALGGRSLAFGEDTVADFNDSVAFGAGTKALSTGSTAFGSRTRALAQYSTALGNSTVAAGTYSVAFGTDTVAGAVLDNHGAFQLKNGTKMDQHGNTAYTDNQGNTYSVTYTVPDGGETHSYVVLKGKDDKPYIRDYRGKIRTATISNDGTVTVSDTIVEGATEDNTLVKAEPGRNGYDLISNSNATAWGESSSASGEASTAFGIGSKAEGKNSLAALGGLAANDNSIAIGEGTKANNTDKAVSVAIGQNAEASGERSLAIGFGVSEKVNDKDDKTPTSTKASGESAIAIGTDVVAKGQHSVAMGSHTDAANDSSVAIGFNTHTVSDSAVAIGSGTKAAGRYSVALGLSSVAGKETNDETNPLNGGGSVAIGYGTSAEASRSIAIGTGATAANADFTTALGDSANAQQRGSIAIGAGSVATRAAGNKEGGTEYKKAYLIPDVIKTTDAAIWTSTEGAVSVGGTAKYQEYGENGKKVTKTKLLTRQITNVAAGSEDTDAVNVAQLKQVQTKHTKVTVEGGTDAGTTAKDGTRTYTGTNLKLNQLTDKNGATVYDLKLADTVTIGGKDGADGTNGVDGHIGVRGKDGEKGANGRDAVSIDGKDGNEGHIGLKGKDGQNAYSDITTHFGPATLNPDKNVKIIKDDVETDAATRLHYVDQNNKEHEVATMDDGQKYAGDVQASDAKANAFSRKLNEQTNVVGGVTKLDNLSTGNNVGVVSNGTDTLTIRLAKKLTDLTSVTTVTTDDKGNKTSETVQDGNGITITPSTLGAGKTAVSLTDKGLSNGGNQITHVDSGLKDAAGNKVELQDATGDVLNNAVNVGDLKKVQNVASAHTAVTVNGSVEAPEAGANGALGNYTDEKKGNLLLAQKKDSTGKITYDLKLNDKVTLGKAGTNGKDGIDGSVGLKGADGKSSIGLNGKDGISVIGKDGKNGVSITGSNGLNGKDGIDGKIAIGTPGKDGQPGKDAVSISGQNGEGHIGLTGPAGKDGKDASADIHVKNGQVGVDGTDGHSGKDGMDRVVYEDHNGVTHEVATMDDGQKYAGDVQASDAKANAFSRKLNEQTNVVGGVTKLDNLSTGNNVGVVSNGTDTLTIRLAKKLTDLTSVTTVTTDDKGNKTSETVQDGNGITITPSTLGAGKTAVSLTDKGLSNGGNQITHVDSGLKDAAGNKVELQDATGDVLNNAVNVGDLKKVQNVASAHTAVTVNGSVEAPEAGANGALGNYTDEKKGNLLLAQKKDSTGKITYDLKLNDKVTLGKAGTNGKDGIDGSVGLKGADGKSSIGLNGKDGISVIGKDGKNGVSITGSNGLNGKDGIDGKIAIGTPGKDGQPGKDAVSISGQNGEGHIGLTGPAGKDGKDASADIHVKNGQVGVDGTDGHSGKDGMDRVVYEDHNGVTHEVATMDDGQKYAGDFGNGASVKLNKTVTIKGKVKDGAKEDDFVDGNIAIVANKKGEDGELLIKLNKDLTGLNSATYTTSTKNGDVTTTSKTVVDGTGLKIDNGPSITNTGIDGGSKKITNVADGEISATSKEAVNGSQLNAVKTLAGQHTTVEAGSKNITVKEGKNSTGGKNYTVDLAKDVAFGDSAKGDKTVAISGTNGTVTAGTGDNKVTVDGSKGQIVAGGDNGVKIGNIEAGDSSLTIYDKDGNAKGTDKAGKYVTNLDNKTWNTDGSYVSGRAATEDQLHQVESNVNKQIADVNTKIDKVDKHHTEVTVNGGTAAKADGSYTDGNLQIAQKTGSDGQKIYDLKLSDNLNIGGAGKDGKDGQNGHMGINGADGKSGIGIDGEDGISIKGKDGKDGVTIKGIDGKNGTEGHIGLTGSAGKDGQNASADIHVKNGQVGVDGTDGHGGKDGMDRVVYEDHNHVTHEVATMDDGMKYSGDSGKAAVKLNKNVQIYGGATEYADGNNIGVVASQDGDNAKLQVKLAKDLKGINSIEAKTITTGDTTMDNSGLTVKGDGNHKDITIHQGNVNMGGNKIEGVAPGKVSQDSTDAVNGSQLWQRDQAINGLSGSVNKLGNRINRVGAGAAALAALHPLDFDPDDKWDFAAGYGNYRGANAAAVGAYYRPNEDTMFSVGGSFGGGENMVNAGVSIKLGQGNHVSTSRVAMAKEIKDLRQNVANLNAIVNRQSALIDKLTGTNAGMIKDKGNDLFPDVPANHWAYEYVTKLKHAGILTGYPDGNFDGDRMMTRYEFAAIVYRAIMAGAASNPALNQDGTLDKLANEFSSEMKYIRIDTIAKDKNGKPTIERVRVISDAK